MNFRLNKKATNKIISVYWFAILFIVAAAVIYMAIVYYGEPYDIRKIEANILANSLADCLSSGGYVNNNLIGSGDFKNKNNLLAECDLNLNVEEFSNWNNDQFYLEINLYNFISGTLLNSFYSGNLNLKENCGKKGKYFPACANKSFYALSKNDDFQYQINILSIVRKTEKNAE